MKADAIAEEVLTQIKQLRNELELPTCSIEASSALRSDLQFDSLDIAVLLVRLEDRLGVDPFLTTGRVIGTVGELVQAYRDLNSERLE